MSNYTFEVAGPEDDADLRRILRETPMPGRITVSFRREPSFFDAAVVEGPFYQAVIARNGTDNAIGLGCRSVRTRYVNGNPQPIGYLSSLRLLSEYRGTSAVARAYRHLRTLHEDGRTPLYLTTIAEGNELAVSVLTKHRAGLPAYHFAGQYHTMVIPLHRNRKDGVPTKGELQIRAATAEDSDEIAGFLQSVGPSKQFFPAYVQSDVVGPGGALRDLDPEDILLAFRQGCLIGTLACWDQHGFRQSVVEAYGGHLRWTRPIYNQWAALRGIPRLPATGQPFRYVTAAIPVVENDDPVVFRRLLQEAICFHRRSQNSSDTYLLLGMHETDPLLPIAGVFTSHSYHTRLYYVCWEDGEAFRRELDDRPPYLELGCL